MRPLLRCASPGDIHPGQRLPSPRQLSGFAPSGVWRIAPGPPPVVGDGPADLAGDLLPVRQVEQIARE